MSDTMDMMNKRKMVGIAKPQRSKRKTKGNVRRVCDKELKEQLEEARENVVMTEELYMYPGPPEFSRPGYHASLAVSFVKVYVVYQKQGSHDNKVRQDEIVVGDNIAQVSITLTALYLCTEKSV